MLTSRQILPSGATSAENIPLLLVSPHPGDEIELRQMIHPSCAPSLFSCDCIEQAIQHIGDGDPGVVICEAELPDGSWKTILGTCEALPRPPILLVISRQADENLWAEVLNLGGYDVLLKPFDRAEVNRVVNASCRQWSQNHDQAAKRQPVSSEPPPSSLRVQFA